MCQRNWGRFRFRFNLYRIGSAGYTLTGWRVNDDGTKYFFSGNYKDGAAVAGRWGIGGEWYFFDEDTFLMVTGWRTWGDGKRSYFTAKLDGAAVRNSSWTISGKKYYFDSVGAMRTGWIEWNNGSGWSYFGDDGAMVVGVQIIDGVEYDFGSDGKVDHYLTDAQLRVIEACKTTPSPGGGLCAAWITYVFQNADIGSWNGNADDMYFAYCDLSPSKIKPGMIIAVDSSPASAAGRIYGHVAIYIGNGMVMDNIGSIRTISLDEWVEYYSALSTPKCGWFGKKDLTA